MFHQELRAAECWRPLKPNLQVCHRAPCNLAIYDAGGGFIIFLVQLYSMDDSYIRRQYDLPLFGYQRRTGGHCIEIVHNSSHTFVIEILV